MKTELRMAHVSERLAKTCTCNCFCVMLIFFLVELTTCQRRVQEAGEPLPGKYIPQCTEAGEFHPMQCHGSIGYCWCVNEQGDELEGTRSGRGEPRPECISGKFTNVIVSSELKRFETISSLHCTNTLTKWTFYLKSWVKSWHFLI